MLVITIEDMGRNRYSYALAQNGKVQSIGRNKSIKSRNTNKTLSIHVSSRKKIIDVTSPRFERLPSFIAVMVITNLMISQKRKNGKIRTVKNSNI